VSRWVIDASLTLEWYLKDEEDRDYSLAVLAGLRENEGLVPFLWTYEVSNALVMAHRRKRITIEEVVEILGSIAALPISVDRPEPEAVMQLPRVALKHELTAYDAAYLELALRMQLPLATRDKALKRAMASLGVQIVEP
jgi:predicted nucleic acid-binding protein